MTNDTFAIESLLVPITPECPMGINLEYEPIYSEIVEARKSDPVDIPQGAWSFAHPRKANWYTVRMLCEKGLISQGKDLRLACWYVESLAWLSGLEGACAGINFLGQFLTRFWQNCWPAQEEEDGVFRRAILERLDRDISDLFSQYPLLGQETTSLVYWRKMKDFEYRFNATAAGMEQEGDLSMATFNKAVGHFSQSAISNVHNALENIQQQMNNLDARYAAVDLQQTHPLLPKTQETLIEMQALLKRLRGESETVFCTASPLPAGPEAESTGEQTGMTREQALRQIKSIAQFFRQTEPTSPVPFLMDRAFSWANMTLTEWLDEVLTDKNSLDGLHQLLKGKTASCPE